MGDASTGWFHACTNTGIESITYGPGRIHAIARGPDECPKPVADVFGRGRRRTRVSGGNRTRRRPNGTGGHLVFRRAWICKSEADLSWRLHNSDIALTCMMLCDIIKNICNIGKLLTLANSYVYVFPDRHVGKIIPVGTSGLVEQCF